MGFIFIILFSTVIISALIISYYYLFPQKDLINISEVPKSYFIKCKNRIDIQNNFECAAFSSAYVLRHFGIEADGNELYKEFPHKLPNGIISPKGIIAFFKKRGCRVSFCKGNINTLKKQISRGIPVIAFIKVFPDKRYLHFVPIVGYDEEYLYLADSLKYIINCKEKNYNRKILVSDFEMVWQTGIPFYKNTYILIHEC